MLGTTPNILHSECSSGGGGQACLAADRLSFGIALASQGSSFGVARRFKCRGVWLGQDN
jgi:hypothetical protein